MTSLPGSNRLHERERGHELVELGRAAAHDALADPLVNRLGRRLHLG